MRELERAMKELGLPGAMVFSNVNGTPLADAVFEPLWKKANELNAVIYIHPAHPHHVQGDGGLLADRAGGLPVRHDAGAAHSCLPAFRSDIRTSRGR